LHSTLEKTVFLSIIAVDKFKANQFISTEIIKQRNQ